MKEIYYLDSIVTQHKCTNSLIEAIVHDDAPSDNHATINQEYAENAYR